MTYPQQLPLQPAIDGELELNEEAVLECADWLSAHRIWGQLTPAVINAIAHCLRTLLVEADTEIYRQGLKPVGLYLIKSGSVEIYQQYHVSKTHITYCNLGDVFGYLPLVEQQANATYSVDAITVSQSEIWFLAQDDFVQLEHNYPEIQGIMNNVLAEDLNNFAQLIAKEQARVQGLQSYIQSVPIGESILGESKASQKLQQQVKEAIATLKPVILQAPSGSGKTFIAGLIHAHSELKNRPFAEIDLAQLPGDETGSINTDIIFGGVDHCGVIELLETGTLLIDNCQLFNKPERDRLSNYLTTGEIQTEVENSADSSLSSGVRLILASPHKISLTGVEAHEIKLFPLSQRQQDIPDFAEYFLNKFCRENRRSILELNQADIRRLISYDYPANLVELEGILKRAIAMSLPEETMIPEQVLWSMESQKNTFRIDLLNQIPWLRQFLLSKWWPEGFWIVMMIVFIPVTIMGYIGPQTRDSSVTLNFFWAWWWPFYLLLFPIAGRLWCSVCPFMITGEWVRKISLWIYPRKLLPWPTKWLNKWGAWLLWAGFVAIYLWEKLWDLPHTPYLSASLLLIITAGAVIGSIIYERRLWCRYICPIGGMNGMFAKLSMVELRASQQVCGSQCTNYACYKGSGVNPVNFADALPTEGQATDGCPLYSHPAQLQNNRDCVLCMTCLKACPHRSVQINLRFPGADLLENHQGFWAEAALMLLLFGGVFMHYSQRILGWVGIKEIPLNSEHLLTAIPVVSLLLGIPFVATYFTHQIARIIDHKMPDYLTTIYAYLPMTLAANLAYYIPDAVTEAGKIIPVIARTFGYSGLGLPTLTWSMDVAAFLQGVTLLLILPFSIYPLIKITKLRLLNNLPHICLIVGFIGVFFQLMF